VNIISLAIERRKRAYSLIDRLHPKTKAVLLLEAYADQEANGQPLDHMAARAKVNEWIEGIWK
jgi:hypothetical protein